MNIIILTHDWTQLDWTRLASLFSIWGLLAARCLDGYRLAALSFSFEF